MRSNFFLLGLIEAELHRIQVEVETNAFLVYFIVISIN